MSDHDGYISPLTTRNASPEMQNIWSAQRKHTTWRRLWLALAESEKELGLDISDEQIQQLRDHLEDIDFDAAAKYESSLRHDVMAHINTYGDAAPAARPIIHLGATSQFVNCNTEILLLRESLQLIAQKMANVIDSLGRFCTTYRALPTLGFTHYQPAQPTTVGKRATLWAYDLAIALEDIETQIGRLKMRGVKGATGTQASFLSLFDGDATKVERLDELVVERMGFDSAKRYVVTGQTYPRIVDAQVLNSGAVVASAIHKMCNDIRLLANRKELEEPFAKSQIGSSAMPYKRNPMRCERATGLSRFVMSLAPNALQTAATQWMERTLDDSSNRRLALAESFLALDGALDVAHSIVDGMVVYEHTVHQNLMAELPFMASENIMMAAVRQGADRQDAHEHIRVHSQAAGHTVKNEGKPNDLIDRLRGDAMFANVDLDGLLDPQLYVGRAPEQVDVFIESIVQPIRTRFASTLAAPRDPKV